MKYFVPMLYCSIDQVRDRFLKICGEVVDLEDVPKGLYRISTQTSDAGKDQGLCQMARQDWAVVYAPGFCKREEGRDLS